ncbi:MAG: hypothetical protein E6I10_05370 [Chloroflexi bacterium]|nr:MAG: hypothetical protein E6I10_05370 [Chloroflexota bacterium]
MGWLDGHAGIPRRRAARQAQLVQRLTGADAPPSAAFRPPPFRA